MPMTAKMLVERGEKAFGKTTQWYSLWKDAYRLCLPQRDLINQAAPGQTKTDLVFDSSGMQGLKTFANRLQQALFPPFRDFIALKPGPAVPAEHVNEVNEILQDAADKWHGAIHRSNFDTAISEGFLELGVGTMVLLMDEGEISNPFKFGVVPAPMLGLEQGPGDGVGAIFRKDRRPARTIEMTWPGSEIPGSYRRPDKIDEEVDLIEATYLDYDKATWYYDVVILDGPQSIYPKGPKAYGIRTPWIVARWMKAANEVFGRGPVLDALPDIRTANKTVELVLKNASIAIAGVYTGVDDGIFNPDTVVIAPGRVIPVAHNGGGRGPSLMPLQSSAQFDVSQLVLADMRESIKRHLFDSNLPPEAGPVRSPTEFIARMRQSQMDIGAPFGRLMKELVHPLVHRGLDILDNLGIIELPFDIDGQTVEAQITSPIAQEQALDKVETAINWMQLMGAVGGQEMVSLNSDMEAFGPWSANELGVDADLVRDEDSKAQLLALTAQMLAAARAQEAGTSSPPAEGGPPAPGGQPELELLPGGLDDGSVDPGDDVDIEEAVG